MNFGKQDTAFEEYIVFEGNRRLGALHYIWNKYKHLPQVPNKFSKIDCKVFDNLNEDQMQELVKMYHGEGQKLNGVPMQQR